MTSFTMSFFTPAKVNTAISAKPSMISGIITGRRDNVSTAPLPRICAPARPRAPRVPITRERPQLYAASSRLVISAETRPFVS